jgi:hypothetical protein
MTLSIFTGSVEQVAFVAAHSLLDTERFSAYALIDRMTSGTPMVAETGWVSAPLDPTMLGETVMRNLEGLGEVQQLTTVTREQISEHLGPAAVDALLSNASDFFTTA